MKTQRLSRTRAFTLVELLVVITIVAILASLTAAGVVNVMDQANRVKVRVVLMEVKNGIESYQLDYNRYPLDSSATSANGEDVAEVLTDGSNSLVDALMGIPAPAGGGSGVELNPKHLQFSQFQPANNGRHGFVGATRPYRLNDMWGQPYHILMDTNGDNQVKNPDVANSDPKISQNQPAYQPMKVGVYSCGKDLLPRTGDDVTSWRPKG